MNTHIYSEQQIHTSDANTAKSEKPEVGIHELTIARGSRVANHPFPAHSYTATPSDHDIGP